MLFLLCLSTSPIRQWLHQPNSTVHTGLLSPAMTKAPESASCLDTDNLPPNILLLFPEVCILSSSQSTSISSSIGFCLGRSQGPDRGSWNPISPESSCLVHHLPPAILTSLHLQGHCQATDLEGPALLSRMFFLRAIAWLAFSFYFYFQMSLHQSIVSDIPISNNILPQITSYPNPASFFFRYLRLLKDKWKGI